MQDPYGLTVSGSNLFVANGLTNWVGEYTTTGATVNSNLTSGGLGSVSSVAIFGSNLFVMNGAWISEFTTSGAVVNRNLIVLGADRFDAT